MRLPGGSLGSFFAVIGAIGLIASVTRNAVHRPPADFDVAPYERAAAVFAEGMRADPNVGSLFENFPDRWRRRIVPGGDGSWRMIFEKGYHKPSKSTHRIAQADWTMELIRESEKAFAVRLYGLSGGGQKRRIELP